MNSITCAECGLVNFASAPECKRCHVRFHHPEPVTDGSSSVSEASSETIKVDQQQAPLAPVSSEYFTDEPAPYSVLVILFAISLTVTVLAVVVKFKLYLGFMSSNTWDVMTDPQFTRLFYTPVLEPLVYMELLVNGAVFLAVMTLLYLLSAKSWLFMKWVRVYLIAGLVYRVVEIMALVILRASLPSKDIGRPFNLIFETQFWVIYALIAFASTVVTLSWLAYFETSERVKRIFIN
jgi:hypothetical protein